MMLRLIKKFLFACLFWTNTVYPAAKSSIGPGQSPSDLSLGKVLNLEMRSLIKNYEIKNVPAAIYTITAEDIKRTGATRIQDVLALIPGVWLTDNTYSSPSWGLRNKAVGFPNSFDLLIDGMSLKNPITGGIILDGWHFPLEKIKKIEVIKSPGHPVPGSISSKGIINIITKNPSSPAELTS